MTPAAFCDLHLPVLERDQVRHNILVFALTGLAKNDGGGLQTWSLGNGGACAVMGGGRPLLLGELDRAQCGELAEQTAGIDYLGVVGPDDTALWFAGRAGDLGLTFADPIPQMIHSLTGPPRIPPVGGHARRARATDEIVGQWILDFIEEATPHDSKPSPERLKALTGSRDNHLWIVDDRPVAIASIVRRSADVIAIGGVYTPPELRRRGYAGAVTAATVLSGLEEGKSTACLYTDLRNPYSNRCYARLGFQPVCRSNFVQRIR